MNNIVMLYDKLLEASKKYKPKKIMEYADNVDFICYMCNVLRIDFENPFDEGTKEHELLHEAKVHYEQYVTEPKHCECDKKMASVLMYQLIEMTGYNPFRNEKKEEEPEPEHVSAEPIELEEIGDVTELEIKEKDSKEDKSEKQSYYHKHVANRKKA